MADLVAYDVAVWRYWPSLFSSYDGTVQAQSPLLAVLALMEQHKLKHVAYAGVGLSTGGGVVARFSQGLSRYTGLVPGEYGSDLEYDTQEVEA